MTALHFRGAAVLARDLREGRVGARELLEHFLDRIDRHNPRINAVVFQDREGARRRADAADAARERGQLLGPLHGLPMTVKESYHWTGSPTTWGIPALRENVSTEDALALQRLAAAGANVFGKTNVPIRLADFQSYNDLYGTTGNPWDPTRTPGGSSGGSAATLAAGLSGFDIGSDIGGSIRNPAHYCGVFGHKPTWNLLPPRGHALGGVLSPTDIAVIGPLGRSADDLALGLQLMAGPDELESAALRVQLPALDKPTKALRIAVWASDPMCPTSAAVAARLDAVVAALAAEGATIDTRARPAFDALHSHQVFSGLLLSAMAARASDAEFEGWIAEARALDPKDDSERAWTLRFQTLRTRDWARLNEARTQLRWAWHRFFGEWDFVLTPMMPTTAFAHDHRPTGERRIAIDGTEHPYFAQTFWAGLAGVAYLPATVIPAGNAADGLPVGAQIIGPAYGDARTIALAQRLQALGFAFVPPPGFD